MICSEASISRYYKGYQGCHQIAQIEVSENLENCQ